VLTNWVVRQRSMHELVTIPLGNPGLQRNWQVLTLADFTAPWLDDFVQLLIHQNPVSPSNI
jgi:hypothetical protein